MPHETDSEISKTKSAVHEYIAKHGELFGSRRFGLNVRDNSDFDYYLEEQRVEALPVEHLTSYDERSYPNNKLCNLRSFKFQDSCGHLINVCVCADGTIPLYVETATLYEGFLSSKPVYKCCAADKGLRNKLYEAAITIAFKPSKCSRHAEEDFDLPI